MRLSKNDIFCYIGCFCFLIGIIGSLWLDYAKAVIEKPAKYADLSKACVCLCFGLDKVPFGSGFFTGHRGSDKVNKVYLVTAAHVAREFADNKENKREVGVFCHTPHLSKDSRRMMLASGDWIIPVKGTDIGYVDFTESFYKLRAEKVDVSYILVGDSRGYEESSELHGVTVAGRADFDKYGIDMGTEVKFIGNILEFWKTKKVARRTRQPLGLRAGMIATVNDAGILDETKPSGSAIIVDGLSHQGMSGAATFASYRKNGYDYPILIGLVRGALMALTYDADNKDAHTDKNALAEFTTVNPIDALLKDLQKKQ